MPACYCTYFDSNYLIKGVTMLRSLRRFAPNSPITVLCLDALTLGVLQALDFGNIEFMTLAELEEADPDLLAVKTGRKLHEYYWTLTPCFMRLLLGRAERGAGIVYVDADQMFFSPPETIEEELGNADVLIQSHNFSQNQKSLECHGKYNVGVLGARNTEEGGKIISWWRDRCLEWCFDYLGGEYQFGDQKYLDLFESLSAGVRVIGNLGVGVAPWNHDAFPIFKRGPLVFYGHIPVVVYHYHSLKMITESIVAPMPQKSFYASLELLQYIFLPYVEALKRSLEEIRSRIPGFSKGLSGNSILERPDLYIIENAVMDKTQAHFTPAITKLSPEYSAVTPHKEPERNMWEGDFSSWKEAEAASTGYDAVNILEKAVEATRAVVSGKAVAERDTVLLPNRQYSWPTLAGVLLGAAQNGGEVHILDFGGALGSSYRTMSPFTESLPKVRWHIVEQAGFVEAGRREFTTEELQFHESVEECLAGHRVDGVLLSSVLQYLPEPYAFLKEIVSLKRNYILIDRTMFYAGKGDRVAVQHVPSNIYEASYPCWKLDYSRVTAILERAYRIVDTLDGNIDTGSSDFYYKALVAVKK